MLQLDIREVYLQQKKSELVDISCSQKICRLCMHPAESGFRCIREEELEAIQRLTPEIVVNIVKDPIVSTECQIDMSPPDLLVKTENLDKEFDISEMKMSIKAECVNIKSDTCHDLYD
ncbi:uncharacterized protein LOC108914533 [Anoplophora glabripennis]|uniref:uncharacterized protein LOC108914533 n=1 Tax=Anoplophora glabripennis TaxID=217634 RepID=UPI0008734E4C|nr:uncharacterized protein LOC108914533 [Anoplophora glabripennis]